MNANRRLAGAIAANERWSRVSDRRAATAKARENGPASLAYFERQVDPDGVLPQAQRTAMALNARKAHFSRLALAAVKARKGSA
jgi:hypothetical protein